MKMDGPVGHIMSTNSITLFNTSFLQRDQLLHFDNTEQRISKQPIKIYTFNDGWRLSSDNLDHSKDIVPAGSAMIIRRAAKSGGGTVYWMHAPTYVPATFLSPLAASSRKSHGGIGTFDVNMPALNGLGIECRVVTGAAGSHQIVFTFANSVTVAGATATSLTNGSV